MLGGLIAHDAEAHSDLVATLRQLARCNYHFRSAAEELFVHPNTLRYRMSRITEITGVDLTDGEGRLRVELALRILDITGPPEPGASNPQPTPICRTQAG